MLSPYIQDLVNDSVGKMNLFQLISFLCLLVFVHWCDGAVGDTYSIGTGRYDITGPSVEVEMVQYNVYRGSGA